MKPVVEVSIFENQYSQSPKGKMPFSQIIEKVRSKKFASQIQNIRQLKETKSEDELRKAKAKLRAFTTSAICKSGRKRTDPLTHTGIIQIDIDGKDHPDLSYKEIKEKATASPHVFAWYRSPSGDGLKLFARTIANNEQHLGSFLAYEKHFKGIGLIIDPSTKDQNRLCFVSHDPEAFYKDPSEVEPIQPIKLSNMKGEGKMPGEAPFYALPIAIDALEAIRDKLAPEIPKYDPWLKLLSGMFNTYGDEGLDAMVNVFPEEGNGYQKKRGRQLEDVKAGSVFHLAKKIAGWTPPRRDGLKNSIDDLGNISATLSNFVKSLTRADFQKLAIKHFGHPLTNAEGKERAATQKESIVLICDHFHELLNEGGSGAGIVDALLHIYLTDHWQPVQLPEAERTLGTFAEVIGYTASEARFYRTRRALVDQIQSISPMLSKQDEKILINFSNGTLHIENGQKTVKEHDKHNALTYVLPFQYDDEVEAPMFMKYLERVLPDKECQIVLAEFFGWIFLRDLKLEKMLVLYGHGHNGKSVLFDIMSALLGEQNISKLGMGSFKKPESRTPLLGKLLNYGSEVSGHVDPDTIKKASSGEPLEFRRLYGDLFTSSNYARLAFNANNLPPNVEHTTGYFRRFLIIPFEQCITEGEKDPDLADKIISQELPGVMNWILEGMERLRKTRKFSPCKKSDDCLHSYEQESDTVAQFFIDEGIVPCLNSRIAQKHLYVQYRTYCSDSGHKSLGKRGFNTRLKEHHRIQSGKHGDIGHFWHLKFKEPIDQDLEEML